MTNFSLLPWVAGFVALVAPSVSAAEVAANNSPPNILWITAEDMSPNLGCYGDTYASTPHLDRLASESVRYTHAFATAPVCSPARSCLITGVYATSLGTQRLRSAFPLPKDIRAFPAYLREAGYFTTNNVKTDYNVADEAAVIRDAWDRNGTDAHWRQRPAERPFFSVFNLMTTHQSRTSVWPYEQFEQEIGSTLQPEERHDPASVAVPPYYPDTPLVRRNLARYYDCIRVMDQQVGQILADLEADGLTDSTIVFFFSDHGMGLPRGKRVLHDTGMRVPLIIRCPARYASLAPGKQGSTVNRLVSFVDFAPTVLRLARLQIPAYMQGREFLAGTDAPEPQYVFGARDRVDEVLDVARSVRDHRYLYIRNYMPHLSWMPPEWYSDQSPMRRELQQLREAGRLTAEQLTYASTTRSAEELYDTQRDPNQLENLAASPEHQTALRRLRTAHEDWTLSTRDLGYLAESDVWDRADGAAPWTMARQGGAYPLERIFETAQLVGRPEAIQRQIELLVDPDPAVRYWAAIGLHVDHQHAAAAAAALQQALNDSSPPVRVAAASALAKLGRREEAREALVESLQSEQPEDVLAAVRALELLEPPATEAREAIAALRERAREQLPEDILGPSGEPLWLFIYFSADSALSALNR